MRKIFLLVIGLVCFSGTAFANGAKPTPRNSWQCTYTGDEWETVIGPNGIPQQVLRMKFYSSHWRPTKEQAKDEAYDICNNWSVTTCQYDGCDHNR